jgi:hypothetical protein
MAKLLRYHLKIKNKLLCGFICVKFKIQHWGKHIMNFYFLYFFLKKDEKKIQKTP